MGKKVHFLTDLNETEKTANCSKCGLVSVCYHFSNQRNKSYWTCLGKVKDKQISEHPLSDIDEEKQTGVCTKCGLVSIYKYTSKRTGEEFWYCGRRVKPKLIKNHKLSDICEVSKSAYCTTCGLVTIYQRNDIKKNSIYWRCGKSSPNKRMKKQKIHRSMKKDVCELCGFIPKHAQQLDIHHKDGNHYNDTPENMQTLCANCHRLEHVQTEEQTREKFQKKLLKKREAVMLEKKNQAIQDSIIPQEMVA